MDNDDKVDMLEVIFARQKELQTHLGYMLEFTNKNRSDYIKEQSLHCMHEIHEMLQEVPFFKDWKYYAVYDLTKARKELADALHFFVNIALGLGLTAEQLFKLYLDKNHENHARQKDKTTYKKCVEDGDETSSKR